MNTTTVVTKRRLQRRPVSRRLRAGVMMLLVLFLAAITWGEAGAQTEAPEMDVQGNGVSIANGDDTPWHGDGTFIGGANVGESDAETFFIFNTGDANLNLTATPAVQFSGPHAADFYLSTIYNTTIAPGGNTEFVIIFTPSAPGERNATVVIPNNDPDENPYEFAIQGKGKAPEMYVVGNGSIIIADGDMTPSESDGTDIGSANVGDIMTVQFLIFNEGDATLFLTARPEVQISGASASDFAFTDISKNEIEGYGYLSWFHIQFNPSAPGVRSAIVSIPNNDPDENPYTFAIQGTGIAPGVSEMDVQTSSGISIACGDNTPSVTEETDFGAVAFGENRSTTFRIWNYGETGLNLTGTPTVECSGPHHAAFQFHIDNTNIPSGGYTELDVDFFPVGCGLHTATISIPNNDSDENPYTFAIQGTGLAPEMDVRGNHHSIANGDDTPSASDNTDFGSANIGDTNARLFFISNSGNVSLNLTGAPFVVQFSGPHAADFYLSTGGDRTIVPGENSEVDIVFAPSASGLRTATLAIPNNDPDENPYTFAIQGTGIAVDDIPPVIVTKPDPINLWPPNHKYETITVAQCVTSVSDNCATLSIDDVVISQVTSDEPEDAKGGGDGNTKNDIVIASDCRSVQLRSERNGSGNGRVYTIHFAVADDYDNIGAATYLVTVPHSRNGAPAVDDGPVYIVYGCGNGIPKLLGHGDDQSDNDLDQTPLPQGYALEQNYPNPFNPETQIRFAIPEPGMVTLQIFNSAGQLVRTLVASNMAAGYHQVTWNGTDEHGQRVTSGVYIYLLKAGAFTAQNKLVLMK